ncbi:signal peptidase II [Nocardioides bigeumensis]|uniref:Lipoprotein signal peptidase n=1 Tax=Nocardioides bigeumensis TaxID=433657 RepID=A0ABN2XXZ7_9ACTN
MQAARGASLNSSAAADGADTAAAGATGRRYRLIFASVFLTAYAADVLSKVWAVEALETRTIDVVGEWFQLHLVRNPGAAFSTATSLTPALSTLAIAAACVVLFVARRVGSTPWAWSLGLLMAGITGNLTDRLFRDPGPMRGHVIDLFMVPNWPVFNVADICINVGAGLALLTTFRGFAVDGSRVVDNKAEDPAEPGS